MAITNSTTYSPKQSKEFYSTALLTGDSKGVIRAFANVKNSYKVPNFNWGNLLQEDGCAWNESGTGTLASKTISVCSVKINKSLCVQELEDSMLADDLRAGSNHGELPGSFEDYMLTQMGLKISEQVEDLMWNGDTAGSPADLCDGLLKQFVADAGVVDVVGTTLSASNIIAQLALVYAAVPSTISESKDLVFFISPAAAKFYKLAQAALTGNGNAGYVGDKELSYIGIPLIVAPAMPANDIVAAEKNNLWIATDLMSDFDDVMVIPMYETTGSKEVRFVAGFKLGFGYGVSAEIVYYT